MKPQHLFAGLAWLNWFAVTWLLIFSTSIHSFNYPLACIAWILFFFVATFASIVPGAQEK